METQQAKDLKKFLTNNYFQRLSSGIMKEELHRLLPEEKNTIVPRGPDTGISIESYDNEMLTLVYSHLQLLIIDINLTKSNPYHTPNVLANNLEMKWISSALLLNYDKFLSLCKCLKSELEVFRIVGNKEWLGQQASVLFLRPYDVYFSFNADDSLKLCRIEKTRPPLPNYELEKLAL